MNPFENLSLKGVLPDKHIKLLLDEGVVFHADANKIGSSSLDATLNGEMYGVRVFPLPSPGQTIKDLLKKVSAYKFDINRPIVPEQMYIARLNERINFSQVPDLYSYANPKSTSGRDDIHVRLLADGVSAYDTIPANYNGDLWVLIQSNSFVVQLENNNALNQLRFFTEDTRIQTKEQMGIFIRDEGELLFNLNGTTIENRDRFIGDDGSILLPIDLESEIIGYESVKSNEILHFSQVGTLDPKLFWREIPRPKDGMLFLKKDHFYLLSCGFASRVPVTAACEMRPIDDRIANARVHYAGYIDDGWGGSKGAPLTLEVRAYEDMYLQAGQPIARLVYERMAEKALKSYSERNTSNYRAQKKVQFSKHFKAF